ncbi:MAG TPA: two-component regulator propeller domain-containing protein, partial [Chitinophagaceae bacterium]|nr:two-component regulator propeller domain-containing protein [Chitinophagaceae bacterium]
MVKTIILLFLCLGGFTCYTQVNQQYIFHHLGLREGLLSDETNATAQDATGYIWIAGKNGLQRYDGYRFLHFRHLETDTNTLPDNNVIKLAIDKKNRLWMLTSNYKLGYFDVSRFVYHNVPVEFENKRLVKADGNLKLDREKNILLVLQGYPDTAYTGVVAYDETRNIFSDYGLRFTMPDGWHILSFSVDSLHGNYWLGTNKGLVKFESQTGVYNYRGHNMSNDPVIKALQDYTMITNTCLDKQGNFWMTAADKEGKKAHLLKYKPAINKVYDYYETINTRLNSAYYDIRSIVQPDTGTVWITGRNLFIKAKENLDFVKTDLPGEFSIHYDEIRNTVFDREENAWISTNRGIYYMNAPASLFNYIPDKKFGADSVYTSDVVDFLHLPNGHILVASWGNGLFEYDNNFNPVKSEIANQGDKKGEKLVWALNHCSNGDIWAPQQDGYLYIFHAATHTTEKIRDPIFENKTIRQIAEDRNGNIWLSTQGNALIKWIKATNTFQLMRRTDLPVFRLYADKKGDIWAIAGAALKIDIENGSILAQYSTGTADGKHLLAGDITDITQYTDSSYIIASRGLNIVNTGSGNISYFTTANGLPSDYISNIIADKKGNLWIGTENGICNLNFKKEEMHIYGLEDGVYNNGFTPVSSALLNDGRIVFGTNHNIMVFNPAEIKGSSTFPPSKVEITGISVMNRVLPSDSLLQLKNITLSYYGNSLSISFSTLTYTSKYDIVYIMEGLDIKPVPAGNRNEAVYSYLPPGNYTFKVGVPDANGEITHFSSFHLTVSAPFWRTWLFYLVLVLLAGIIMWRIDKERIKRIKEMLQMRNNIGRDLHAAVSATLNKIGILSELAAIKADVNLNQSKDYIQEIKLKSRSTITAMDDVMWSIDPANDSMPKTIERMYEVADAVRHEYDTVINITIDKNVHHYNLSMKERLEYMLIYKKAMLLM